jgi:hypothetical protein
MFLNFVSQVLLQRIRLGSGIRWAGRCCVVLCWGTEVLLDYLLRDRGGVSQAIVVAEGEGE